METKLKNKITKELLETRFYSVPANNKHDSEFANYKVYKLKDIDLCEQLFESPSNHNNAHYCDYRQTSKTERPPTPAAVNDESNFNQCIYCGKQRACQRRKNICCVCGKCFESRDALIDHDEENIESNTCCRCDNAAKQGKSKDSMDHLYKCAR